MPVKREGKLNGIEAKLENGVKRGLILAGMLVAQRAQAKAPIDTGRLKRSITHSMPEQVARLTYRLDVGTNVIYAMAQEFGSGIHAQDPAFRELILIEPKQGGVLAFKWPNAPADLPAGKGGLHYFTRVFHPGVPAQPYLRPALEESVDEAKQLLGRNVVAAFK